MQVGSVIDPGANLYVKPKALLHFMGQIAARPLKSWSRVPSRMSLAAMLESRS